MYSLLVIICAFCLQAVPYKPTDEFVVKLDYQFKPRPQSDANTVNLGDAGRENRRAGGVLPYLIINITLLKLPEEKMKVRLTRNIDDRPLIRKVETNSIIQLDLGFTDDMKDRVSAYMYTVTFLSADKATLNKIVIRVDEDGSFFVNDEKRGKF